MREPIINIATEAARAAGMIIMRATGRLNTLKVAEKSPNNYVTDVDQRVEQEIINIIQKAYPDHSILAEESGEHPGSDYQWIIDPIDGTRNFMHGFPHFAVSIAFAYKNKIEHGLIYDPVRQELFTASRGKGAFLNDRRIRVSARKQLPGCLLGTGKKIGALPPPCGDIRRSGSATLDLAYVACGRLDGFYEYELCLWDIAAGTLMIKEAGGIVCSPEGGEDYLKTGHVVAANPSIMRQLLAQLPKPSTV
jgi:myo-inositol-1(or 4)-monophosphatase